VRFSEARTARFLFAHVYNEAGSSPDPTVETEVAMSSMKVSHPEKSWIQKTPTVCGGDACIRDTRIPVWSFIQAQRLGASVEELLTYFVTPLTPADVQAALGYYDEHAEEIDNEIRLNEEA
jgi:uncharacterized protein (DUF433 family)